MAEFHTKLSENLLICLFSSQELDCCSAAGAAPLLTAKIRKQIWHPVWEEQTGVEALVNTKK